MRFQKLNIPAFGPFTGLQLSFPESTADLHVIYGENEAGKSSLLRAIHDLLYGIPAQSNDNFMHDYKALRLGGEMANRQGQTLYFQRRKGNKNTLLDANEKELPETALAPFLGTVDSKYFTAMFGLGSRELREGAQELLRGEGELGSALFSASLGGTPVLQTIQMLEDEANGLFKPKRAGASLKIRQKAAAYKELLVRRRDAEVNPERWQEVESLLAEAEKQKQELQQSIALAEREIQWGNRFEDALPIVTRYLDAMQQLEQLKDLPEVASDFVQRARAAKDQLRSARAELQMFEESINEHAQRLAEGADVTMVLDREGILDDLHRDLGAYGKQRLKLVEQGRKATELEGRIRKLMRDLQLDCEISGLSLYHVVESKRMECEAAAEALQQLGQKQNVNAEHIAQAELEIETHQSGLEFQPEADPKEIREALAVAAGAMESDKTLASTMTDVKRLTREVGSLHQRVLGAPADFIKTAELPVPAQATVRNYRQRFDKLEQKIEREDEARQTHEASLKTLEAELKRLQKRGELPGEEDLNDARKHRDKGWELVKAEWRGAGTTEEFEPGVPLEEAFPKAIVQADRIVDILRTNSDAVAQAAEKKLQMAQVTTEMNGSLQRRAEAVAALERIGEEWRQEWAASGLTPKSPGEMEEWIERWERFREGLGRLQGAEDALNQKQENIQSAKARLARVLNDSDSKEFSILFEAARKRVEEAEQASGAHGKSRELLGRARARLAALQAERDRLINAIVAANQAWKSECASIRLPEEISPQSGINLLQRRRDMQQVVDAWEEAMSESAALEKAVELYRSRVMEQAAAFEIKAESVEAAEQTLWKLLVDARRLHARREELIKGMAAAQDKARLARQKAGVAEGALQEVMKGAGVISDEEFEPRLAKLERRGVLQDEVATLRKTLSGFARGEPVEIFVESVQGENPEEMVGKRAIAAGTRAEKQRELEALEQRHFELRGQKQELEKGSQTAADLQQEAESCCAGMKQEAARYIRLRFATRLLRDQVEKFRKENQGPMLARSGEIFRAITCDRFSGLRPDYAENDEHVLVGVRANGERVPVGGMSDGSRDQLFLSLRLAALEQHLKEHEPMPLILDDLLITFDDERAGAILLEMLALSRRTQILMFTHHKHLVELCRKTLGAQNVQIHSLGTQVPPRAERSDLVVDGAKVSI